MCYFGHDTQGVYCRIGKHIKRTAAGNTIDSLSLARTWEEKGCSASRTSLIVGVISPLLP
jgi:hypothetical protein